MLTVVVGELRWCGKCCQVHSVELIQHNRGICRKATLAASDYHQVGHTEDLRTTPETQQQRAEKKEWKYNF